MKKIKVQDAVGTILCHDITQIIPGRIKYRAFKKGHIIREEDIPLFLYLGKDHIFVWEQREGTLHENDAAIRLKELTAGEGLVFSDIKEGKIDFIAEIDGLLKVNSSGVFKLNSLGEISFATLHNNMVVKKGQKVAGTRVIPLVIEEGKILKAEELIGEKLVKIIPIKPKKVGIITTGNEIYHGRIRDAFGPVIIKKVEEFGCEVLGQFIIPDDKLEITKAIFEWRNRGAELIICSGGMSVDPDDVTPGAIKDTGANIITYGSPVLPGAMFLLAYLGEIPVMGLPGCVMYSKRTIFDLILPRVLADERINFEDIMAMGHGGLCMDCEECRFPYCSFGKGI